MLFAWEDAFWIVLAILAGQAMLWFYNRMDRWHAEHRREGAKVRP